MIERLTKLVRGFLCDLNAQNMFSTRLKGQARKDKDSQDARPWRYERLTNSPVCASKEYSHAQALQSYKHTSDTAHLKPKTQHALRIIHPPRHNPAQLNPFIKHRKQLEHLRRCGGIHEDDSLLHTGHL